MSLGPVPTGPTLTRNRGRDDPSMGSLDGGRRGRSTCTASLAESFGTFVPKIYYFYVDLMYFESSELKKRGKCLVFYFIF